MGLIKKQAEITGLGVISPIAIGVSEFTDALKHGKTNFSAITFEHSGALYKYPIGKVNEFLFKDELDLIKLDPQIIKRATRLRNISVSAQYGLYCALEAWADAGLDHSDTDLTRTAIVMAGTNTQQATLQKTQHDYQDKLQFLNPNYGLNFFDTDLIGALSELLGIRGEGFSVGAASASGNMALIQGSRLIDTGDYDVVLVVAPLMDLSVYEYQGFTALGAMAKVESAINPSALCRPFDSGHAGFVYGQNAGCMVLESAEHARNRAKRSYGTLAGYGIQLDANRNPDPSVSGEVKAMSLAMQNAGILPRQVDYVNTHGTASRIGDETEVQALLDSGLRKVKANSTKSLIGHGLSAAGLVECIAAAIQMNGNFLHGTPNLTDPISDQINWITAGESKAEINYLLNNSFGFGGVNTSVVLKKDIS